MKGVINEECNSESQSRITWGSTLATGYDRLKIGLYVNWEFTSFLSQLDNAKQEARELDDLLPISFSKNGDLVFNCHPSGRRKGGYGYHLSRADVNIFFSKRKDFSTPNVWIDIGSQSCWSPGWDSIMFDVKKLIESNNGVILDNTVSEVHLCADWVGLDIEEVPIDKVEYWIKRAQKFQCFKETTQLSGVTLTQTDGFLPEDEETVQETGVKVGVGDLMLRIYNKTLELKRSPAKQSLFASVWGKKQYDEEPVTRVEFQLRRPILKQMKINSLDDLNKRKGDVWKYLTSEWARLSNQEVDRKNRHQDRAILHSWWKEVQNINLNTTSVPVKREYPKPTKSLDVLYDLITGCSLSVATLLNRQHNDLEGIIAFNQAAIESNLRKLHSKRDDNGKSELEKRMEKRWREIWPIGFEPKPV